MGKGNIIGPSNNPTISTAKGIWNLSSQRIARSANNWPFGTRVELLTTVTSTTDAANYTFNNIYLGTPSPSRRIFFHTPTDFFPTGNLFYTSTWTTSNGVSNNTLVLAQLANSFPVTADFSVYVARWFSFLSPIIPTANSGNLSISVSTNGVTASQAAPSIFALHNISDTTPTTITSGLGPHTLTNFVPGSIAIIFQTIWDGTTPVVTGSPLAATLVNLNSRTTNDATVYRSIVYYVQNDTSSTVTQTISSTGTGGVQRDLCIYRFR